MTIQTKAKGNPRIELRKELLVELYNHYFESNGNIKSLNQDIEDKEKKLAYIYLYQKGLIELHGIETKMSAEAKINAYGIDLVEEM